MIQALSYSQTGKRNNNQDAFFPLQTTENTRVFIICDGVGGENNGEIAATITANNLGSFLQENNFDCLESGIELVTQNLQQAIVEKKAHPNMATTLVVAYCTEHLAHIAWCGDSRLYHIRNGEIVYQTKDHSLVQQLIDAAIITPNEAINHPKKNIILQSINSNSTIKNIETFTINNIQENDYLLLCTDGLLEHLNPTIINQIFKDAMAKNVQKKLIELVKNNTNDNCTWYLIQYI